MGLQLADGEVEYLIGLLEDTIISICETKITHTFAVVDFGPDTYYKVILGRPFMCQMIVVQYWGYTRLYFRHQENIIWVNLDDRSYKDVIKTAIEDVDTTSFDPIWEITSEDTQEEGA